MAITCSSASRTTSISTPKNTTKTKENKKRQRDETSMDEKEKKKKKKRSKSPGIRLKGTRIYDSENGKTCHQCRQKTLNFSASCKNLTGEKKCSFHYCHICLLNRYGERAEEVLVLGCQWKCPSCRGVCNCSICMKKRGCSPTGKLVHTARASGFGSVSEMLQLKEIEKPEQDEGAPSKKQKTTNEEPTASTKGDMNENGLTEKTNSTCDIKALKKVDRKERDMKEEGENDTTMIHVPTRKEKANEMPSDSKMVLVKNVSSELSNEQDNGSEMQIKVSKIDVPRPQDTELNRVADLGFPAEDAGHALQFLEFCEAFGQVLDLKKGQPELLLRQLTGARDSRRKRNVPVERLHIKLFSIIEHDQENGTSALKARGRNSWLVALGNYITKCPYSSKELLLDCSDLGPDKYEKLSTSKKLRILTFLCDEALGSTKLWNGLNKKTNSTCQIKALENVGGKEKDMKEEGENDTTVILIRDPTRKEKANEMPNDSKMVLVKNTSSELSNEQDNESEDPTNNKTERTQAENKIVSEAQFSKKSAVEIQIKVPKIDIPLPRGTELNRVADLDLLAEDVGHALQFLEFCEAFGQVLDLKKGQPEILLRQLTGAKDSRRKRNIPVERIHIKLLSIIQHDQENGTCSLKARGRNSWLEALEKYIAKCPYSSKELILDCSDLGPDKYEKLSTSKKLRILTFLCDEALGTTELRNWIDEKNSEFLEETKKAEEMFLIEAKNERKKLQNEVAKAKATLLKNRAPLSIAEHENLVSAIKMEAAQSLAEKLEATANKIKRKHSHAVRSYPVLLDAGGRKFWKLRSYREVDVLLQEVAYGDMITAQEKWFLYDISEKANIERYISSFKET